MRLIVTGSLAFDHIMVFQDHFKNHILPEKIHILNVAFNVEDLQKEFGGTAGNIAYTLHLLQEKPEIIATVGQDFQTYQRYLEQKKISTDLIKILPELFTAQCFITTDLDDNQITAFYGGAMFQAHLQKLTLDMVNPEDCVIISPNGTQAMEEHAQFCQKHNLKFIFDPGQSLSALTGTQLKQMTQNAQILIVNDYEWQIFQNKTGLDSRTVLDYAQAVIVTLGKNGSRLFTTNEEQTIPAAQATQEIDPTGCGDAYRAGLLFGFKKGVPLEKAARFASAVASFAIEQNGTQNHSFTLEKLVERYKITFAEDCFVL